MTATPRHVRADHRERGSGSIRRRGDSFDVELMREGKRYRQTAHTRAEAEQVLVRWTERLAQGLEPDPVVRPRRPSW